ncbi:MAG: glycoside hydrolase family 5 protein [Oceanicaulis sp.]
MTTRRSLLAMAGGVAGAAFAPAGLRPASTKRDLWRNAGGPHLRGAVFVQRRVYRDLDGPDFLGPGPFGQPVTPEALDSLTDAGANLASWSGPGLFTETAPFALDPAVEDHVGAWLDACRARGLYTTLCLRTGPGRSAFAFHPGETWYPDHLYDDSIWRSAEKQQAWAEMVAETLRRFGSHPALAGVKVFDEPNGADMGADGVWPAFAQRIKQTCQDLDHDTPLIFSPDRWGRAERAEELRAAIGVEPVIAVHDYSPFDYTHQARGDRVRFYPRLQPAQIQASGDVAVMEFGAVRYARDLEAYLDTRIAAFERAGANWAVFRWSSGWQAYESQEGSMAISQSVPALLLLLRAFSRNAARPG